MSLSSSSIKALGCSPMCCFLVLPGSSCEKQEREEYRNSAAFQLETKITSVLCYHAMLLIGSDPAYEPVISEPFRSYVYVNAWNNNV